ncbi:hypothetical protein [Micrococcus luteus]|uniref:hypothetical protein n=1 Tax=Micrococcus luteus TaxID=1270 RepID=UPI003808838A
MTILCIVLIVGGTVLGALGVYLTPGPMLDVDDDGTPVFTGDHSSPGAARRSASPGQTLTILGLALTALGGVLSLFGGGA